MHTHFNTRVILMMSMQAHLRQFHLEVQEGEGAIPIDLNTPTSLRKADHHGAYVYKAGGGSTLSDVKIRIVVGVNTPLKMLCI